MTITEIHKQRGRLYQLEIDGEPAVKVDMRTFDESSYKVGSVLDDESLHELIRQSDERRAKEKAFYLLSMRDHSRVELQKKLENDANAEIAARTAERMEELGLVNDEDYAYRLARDVMLRKLYPRRRAVQELQTRGIERDLANEAVEAVETDDEQLALQMIERKYKQKLNSEEGKRKVTAALARFGFGYESIRRAMRLYEQESP